MLIIKHLNRKTLCCLCLTLLISLKLATVRAEESNEVRSNINLTQQQLLPLPSAPILDKKKVNLGAKLFNDPILSGNQKFACSSCHLLKQGGDDNRQFSLTDTGTPRQLNTPTIFNVSHNATLLWSGTTRSLPELLNTIIQSPITMHADWTEIITRFENRQDYINAFNTSFDDGLTQNNIIDALVVFQESLVTPSSRFDQYLKGDETALTDSEKQGYNLFYSYGCTSCHQGKNIGGNMYQKFGLYRDYYEDMSTGFSEKALGRFNITGNERDKFFFRVPSLRNVAVTAPYLHDGSINSLDETIRIMGAYQLGRAISKEDRKSIEAFLKTLTGQYNNQLLSAE